ncbi:MAG: LysM peptidoglycan-binding domain-containing protein [Thermoflexales bacterium]|nr:LysM peptidoglycan-binding domain-containing protein [Thermoflexales bacterium]
MRNWISLLLAIIMLACALPLQAAPAGQDTMIHTVEEGDTAFSIARRYNVSVEALCAANGITDPSLITVGQQLLIPTSGAPEPAVTPATAEDPAPLAAYSTLHIVQAGENLYRLALRYGTTIEAIMTANALADERMIIVGQELVIPGGAGRSAPVGQPASSGGANLAIVQWDDTLPSIALRHNVTLWALMQANGQSSHIIYPGQRLTIPGKEETSPPPEATPTPPPSPTPQLTPEATPTATPTATPQTVEPAEPGDTYTVRPGDTLFQIAQRFGTTISTLTRLNELPDPSAIYAGQMLRLAGAAAPPPPSAGNTWGKRIVVDLSEQHLYAYEGSRLVYSFVASSGAAPTYTRAGEFSVQSKIPSAYGSTWDIWMPSWLGIYWAGSTENGIHALPILSNGQTLWAGYLGSPISYGCVVLGTYEAKLLYDWAEIGTPVVIQY